MKLYLIRHGETDWNIVKRLQGSTDIPLNENGEAIAKETCRAMNDIHFDIIYTSPLKRAYRTAELVKGERDIPLLIDERLREISFGDYEGLISKSEGYSIPDPDFKFFFTKTDCYTTPPNGESIESLFSNLISRVIFAVPGTILTDSPPFNLDKLIVVLNSSFLGFE